MGNALDSDYLSVISPGDVKFDKKKVISLQVANLYSLEGSDGFTGFVSGKRVVSFVNYSSKILSCGSWLKFAQMASGKVKLIDARFCHAPNCPMCQWRRTLVWRAKFLSQLPKIRKAYPSHRWLFLTLTVKNCKLGQLRDTIKHMSTSYNRMRKLADYPFEGYIRSLEVTRAWDWYDKADNFLGRHGVTWYERSKEGDRHEWRAEPTDEVHPHYHVLALVPASYFTGRAYVKQERWTEMWQQSLRADYKPMVHIQTVKNKQSQNPDLTPDSLETDKSGMIKGICETMKYTVKEDDLVGKFSLDNELNSDFLKGLTEQMYMMRRIEYSGILKEFGKEVQEEESQNENLVKGGESKEEKEEVVRTLVFKFQNALERFVKSSER
jgi:plasmid rolling circle replication initiator protein Rep